MNETAMGGAIGHLLVVACSLQVGLFFGLLLSLRNQSKMLRIWVAGYEDDDGYNATSFIALAYVTWLLLALIQLLNGLLPSSLVPGLLPVFHAAVDGLSAANSVFVAAGLVGLLLLHAEIDGVRVGKDSFTARVAALLNGEYAFAWAVFVAFVVFVASLTVAPHASSGRYVSWGHAPDVVVALMSAILIIVATPRELAKKSRLATRIQFSCAALVVVYPTHLIGSDLVKFGLDFWLIAARVSVVLFFQLTLFQYCWVRLTEVAAGGEAWPHRFPGTKSAVGGPSFPRSAGAGAAGGLKIKGSSDKTLLWVVETADGGERLAKFNQFSEAWNFEPTGQAGNPQELLVRAVHEHDASHVRDSAPPPSQD